VDVAPRGAVDVKEPWAHRTDFTVYTEAGAAFFDGREPYQVANLRGWHYLYPPLFAMVVAPLHGLPPKVQVIIWFVLSVFMSYGCYYEVRRLLQHFTTTDRGESKPPGLPPWLGPAALLAVLVPLLNCLQRGQVEALKLYLLFLGLRLAVCGRRRRDWALAGAVLALPIALKLTPLLPVACLVFYEGVATWLRRSRQAEVYRPVFLAVGLQLGLAVSLFLLPASLVGWSTNLRHLQTWYSGVVTKVNDVRTTDFGENVTSVRNQSFDNALFRFGNWFACLAAGAPDDTTVDHSNARLQEMPMAGAVTGGMSLATRLLALGCLLLVTLRASKSGDRLAGGAVFGLACAATLVICPVARGHYFVMVVPALLFNSMWLNRLGHCRTARILAVTPALLIWLHYVLLPWTGRVGLLGLGTTAWYFANCAVLDHAIKNANAGDESRLRNSELRPLRLAA
jgi:hypothetical protein